MNHTVHPDRAPELDWPAEDQQAQVPGTPVLPGRETAPPPAVGLLAHAVQVAHQTIDQLAGSAAPVVEQLGERMATADVALQRKSAQLRGLRNACVDSVRSTVRANPLAALAAAVVVGAVIVRLSR